MPATKRRTYQIQTFLIDIRHRRAHHRFDNWFKESRKQVTHSNGAYVSSLRDGFISVVEAHDPSEDLVAWVTRQQHGLGLALVEQGGILLRGFSSDRARFARAVDVISPARVDYTGGNSPRTEVADGIFTASELPPDFRIASHHEMSIA